jgi:hypothetical protein
MTKRWSTVRSDLTTTKRAASKKARHLTREEQQLFHAALRKRFLFKPGDAYLMSFADDDAKPEENRIPLASPLPTRDGE